MAKLYSLISSIHPTNSSTQISNSTRAKAVYAMSAALKHWPGAVANLTDDSNRGWSTLREGLSDPDPTIRRKIAFLINTLLIQSTDMPEESTPSSAPVAGQPNEMINKMAETKVIDALLKSVIKPLPMGADGDISEADWDLQEKCTRALVSALERGGLDAEQRKTLSALWQTWKIDHEWENVGFTKSEAEQAMKLL
jgi:hsp70-interacting protein